MFELIRKGKTVPVAVYGNNPDPVDDNAVYEYALFMRLCTAQDQKVYAQIPQSASTFVFIGADNAEAKKLGVRVPREQFKDDTVYILVRENYVVLDGGCRGKLYAVYEFLERFMGVRFYAPEHYKTPRATNVCIEDCEIMYTPQIEFRSVYGYDVRWDREFCARVRCNSEAVRTGLKHYGGALKWSNPGCHTTFDYLFRPEDEETGFAKHPEYYSFRKDKNARVGRHHTDYGFLWGEGEICWSNPDVIDILTERIKVWVLDNTETEIFSVSQNDWPEHCECEACTKLAEKYGKDGELRWSAPVVYALNEIARRIKAWQQADERVKNRRIFLETFAYQYSTMPPVGLRVEDNVIIRLCTHECCFYHTLDDKTCPLNRQFALSIEGWKEIAKHIYVWDYANNHTFHIAFNTILNVIQKNVQYLAQNNVMGIFEEYQGGDRLGTWFFVRQYLYARALWNPDLDFQAEYKEAMEFFYEEAAPYLMEVERRFQENTNALENFHPGLAYTILAEHYTPEFLESATQLFELALTKVKREVVRLRVRKEYACLKWTKMYLNKGKDYFEMDAVYNELEALDIHFPKMDSFKNHFLGGKKNDLYLPEIEDRNRKRELQKLQELSFN